MTKYAILVKIKFIMTINPAKNPTSPASQPASKPVQQPSADNTVVPPQVEPKDSPDSTTIQALHAPRRLSAGGSEERRDGKITML